MGLIHSAKKFNYDKHARKIQNTKFEYVLDELKLLTNSMYGDMKISHLIKLHKNAECKYRNENLEARLRKTRYFWF